MEVELIDLITPPPSPEREPASPAPSVSKPLQPVKAESAKAQGKRKSDTAQPHGKKRASPSSDDDSDCELLAAPPPPGAPPQPAAVRPRATRAHIRAARACR